MSRKLESAYTTDHVGTSSSRRGRGGSRGGHGAVQGRACQSNIKCYGCGGAGHVKRLPRCERKERAKIEVK